MADAPPQLGEIPQRSELSVPTLQSNMADNSANGSLQNTKDALYDSKTILDAQTATNYVQNHPATQNVRQTVSNGPVAETVKDQHAKTTSEFQSLADSRTSPNQSTATGQPLTHYHSFFYNLLSVMTASAELVGKLVLGNGLARVIRPKKYYTIPRETLEASLEDVEQLINFFVIEFQRILFAENVTATGAAFFAALISYWLIKFTPLWGLTLIATSTLYLTPLIYKSNKDFIDAHLENASNVVNSQATQVKDLTAHHVGRYSETAKQYAGDYTAKAQNYMGGARGRSTSPEIPKNAPIKSEPGDAPAYQPSDFPHAPKQEPTSGATSHQEQYQNSQFGGQAQPAT
ncbi:MAG: hypothetical protein Q9195_001850 [Heterodermia aff. obscurata]